MERGRDREVRVSGANDDVVEEVDVLRHWHVEVAGDGSDDDLVRDAPDHSARLVVSVASHVFDVLLDASVEGFVIFDDRDVRACGLGIDVGIELLLPAEVARDARILKRRDGLLEAIGHGVDRVEDAPEG